MNLEHRQAEFVSRFTRELKQFGFAFPSAFGTAHWLSDSYHDYAAGGYAKNELVYSCIARKMDAFAEAPLKVYDAAGDAIPHEVSNLIRNPNPFMSEYELMAFLVLYLELAGNAYWHKVRSAAGRVVELWPIRPDMVSILTSAEKYLVGYEVRASGDTLILPPEDVIHFRYPSPLSPILGMSPLRSAVRAISTDNETTEMKKVILQNAGIPGVVIETDSKLEDKLIDRLRKAWRQRFAGENRGDPAFMSKGMTVKKIGMDFNELALPDLTSISETRICMVFKVPPIIVGARAGLERSTFSNFAEARTSFYQDTIIPLQNQIDDKINSQLTKEFSRPNQSVQARFDISNVAALQSLRDERFDRADKAVKTGWMTINQALEFCGKTSVPTGDVYLRPLNIIEVPATKVTSSKGLAHRLKEFPTLEKKSNGLELLRIALGRVRLADSFFKGLRDMIEKEFKLERGEINRLVRENFKAITLDQINRFAASMTQAAVTWKARLAEEADPILRDNLKTSAEAASAELGFDFEMDNSAQLDFIRDYSFKFADRVVDSGSDRIRGIIQAGFEDGISPNGLRIQIQNELDGWITGDNTVRADMIARTETIRISNQGAVMAYRDAGIVRLEWLAALDACPYCQTMNGRVVDIGSPFLGNGDPLIPTEESGGEDVNFRPLVNTYDTAGVETPPLHPNCRCTIIPSI